MYDLAGCVCERVEEGIGERAVFVVGYIFDYWIVWRLFMKLLWILMGVFPLFSHFLFFNNESLVWDRWIALWRTLTYIYLSWIAGDGWQRRKAQADAPEMESWDGWALRLHVFPSGEYPCVPFVLAFAVSKTDVPETDGVETDAPETDVPETEEGRDGCPRDGCPRDGWHRDGCPRDGCRRDGCPRDGGRPRRMPLRRMSPRRMALRRMSPRRRKAETEETDVPDTEGLLLLLFFCNIVESLSGSYCLIMFEWCVWVQRCVGLVDGSSGVCGWVCMGACGGAYGRKSMFFREI